MKIKEGKRYVLRNGLITGKMFFHKNFAKAEVFGQDFKAVYQFKIESGICYGGSSFNVIKKYYSVKALEKRVSDLESRVTKLEQGRDRYDKVSKSSELPINPEDITDFTKKVKSLVKRKELRLEVGKFYVDGEGEVYGPMYSRKDKFFPFCALDREGSPQTFDEYGCAPYRFETPYNLVKEVPVPEPVLGSLVTEPLQLRVDGYYQTAGGWVFGPMVANEAKGTDIHYPFKCREILFTKEGFFYADKRDHFDNLIHEVNVTPV